MLPKQCRTRRAAVFLLGFLAATLSGPHGRSEAFTGSVLLDFGRDDLTTASPDAFGRTWNNSATTAAAPPSVGVANMVNEAGTPTAISLTVGGFGSGANTAGTSSPDAAALGPLAVASATRDGYFIAASDTGQLTFSGMAANGIYRFTFFASRDAADTRETRFTATGAGTTAAVVTTSGSGLGVAPEPDANRSAVAVLADVTPAANGSVVVAVTVESGGFAYVGALQLERTGTIGGNQAPSAGSVAWIGAPVVGRPLTASYVYSDLDNDAEAGSSFIWERASVAPGPGTPILGADSATYTPTVDDAGQYLRVIVTPAAATGTSPGTSVASPWRGPIAEAGALAVFHVGNSFTRWGDVPRQVQLLAAAEALAHASGDQLTDGQNLSFHWTQGLPGGSFGRGTPVRAELATATWDAFVLQPQSREWQPANLADFLARAEDFDALADAAGTRIYLYAYWPYLSEPVSTQDDIDAAFESVRQTLSLDGPTAYVIPVGDAFRRVVDAIDAETISGITRDDLYQDDIHPSDIGYYLSALVHFAVLHQRSPVGLPAEAIDADPNSSATVNIDPAVAGELQRIAWEAVVEHPWTGLPSPTPTPTVTVTATATATATATPSAAPSNTPAGACGTVPRLDCRPAGRSKLQITDRNDPARRALGWKWERGAATAFPDWGYPDATTDYTVCVWDADAGTPQLAIAASVPAALLDPRGRPAWRTTGSATAPRGWQYGMRSAAPEGVTKVILRHGDDASAKFQVKAKGALLALPGAVDADRYFVQSPSVTAQLLASDTGLCWEAKLSASERNNRADRFRGSCGRRGESLCAD